MSHPDAPNWGTLSGTQKAAIRDLADGAPIDDIDGQVVAELIGIGAIKVHSGFHEGDRVTIRTQPPRQYDRGEQHNRAQTREDRAHLDEITAWQHQITQVLTQRHNSTDGDRTLKRRIAVLERAKQLIEQELTK